MAAVSGILGKLVTNSAPKLRVTGPLAPVLP